MKTNLVTFTLPSYWASALINNDYSSLNDDEKSEVAHFLATNGCPDFVEVSEYEYFSKYNDAFTEYGCECSDYKAFM